MLEIIICPNGLVKFLLCKSEVVRQFALQISSQ